MRLPEPFLENRGVTSASLRTLARSLGLASLLATLSAPAFAQQPAPDAPPNPPPPGQPQPGQPPPGQIEPAPQPAPVAPPPAGAQPQDPGQPQQPPADKPAPKAAPPKPLPWRATNFVWSHQASTQIFGLGAPYQSGTFEAYSWNFSANPGYFVLDTPNHKIRLVLGLNAQYELTNNDVTTRDKEFLFGDIAFGPTYIGTILKAGGGATGQLTAAQRRDPTLAGGQEYITTLLAGGRLFFPTSKFSLSQGVALRTSLFFGAQQVIKLLGNSAPGLQNVTLRLVENWRHTFASASTPTNGNLHWLRQGANGATFESDQLGGFAFDENTLTHSLDIILPIYGDLTVFSSFQLQHVFPFTFQGQACEAQTLTGCVQADRDPNRTALRVNTGFDFSLYYQIVAELGVTLGYSNYTGQLAPNGQYRDFFWSPDAYFHADATVSLDAIYSRIANAVNPPKKQALIPLPFRLR